MHYSGKRIKTDLIQTDLAFYLHFHAKDGLYQHNYPEEKLQTEQSALKSKIPLSTLLLKERLQRKHLKKPFNLKKLLVLTWQDIQAFQKADKELQFLLDMKTCKLGSTKTQRVLDLLLQSEMYLYTKQMQG